MKKAIFTLLTLTLTLGLHAQVTTSAGLRGGLNLASITNMDADRMADFYVGGLVGIQFTDFYTLQPELTYTRQGAEFRYLNVYEVVPTERTDKYELQYLSIGVMNKFRIAGGFHALVGPSIDIKINDSFHEDLAGADLALAGGVGYQFDNGLGIEARFKQGLVDIFGTNLDYGEDDYYNDSVDFIRLNNVFQIGLTYNFKK